MTSDGAPTVGLRERKKARTRVAIRDVALRLFEEQGYAETTVEQIAEAAEVSPSTYFRYFPTKEAVILIDDWDPLMADAIRDQPAELGPIDAMVGGMRAVIANLAPGEWERERRRQAIFQSVPELRQRYMQQMLSSLDLLAAALAARADKPADDLESRVVAGALVGVAMAIWRPGDNGLWEQPDLQSLVEGVAALRRSL
jgi:AcrR family transcriptional regulator